MFDFNYALTPFNKHNKYLYKPKTKTMKKTIISFLIILLSLNINGQSQNEIFSYKGIVALFEKKLEFVYDVAKEDFISENSSSQRSLFFLSDKEITIENKKYKIRSQETEKEYDKSTDAYFDFIEYDCIDTNGEEIIIEITKLKDVVYGVRIYYWNSDKKLSKISYQH